MAAAPPPGARSLGPGERLYQSNVDLLESRKQRTREVLANTEQVLAIEWICAAQAREFHPELRAGRGAYAARAALRTRVPALDEDRYLHPDLVAACELLRDGSLVRAVEEAAGPLGA